MNARRLLQQMFCLTSIVSSLIGCGGASTVSPPMQTSAPATSTSIPPTATPTTIPSISKPKSRDLHQEWEFVSLVYGYDKVSWDADGKIMIDGDIAIDFAVRNPPRMAFVDESGEKYFEFDAPLPMGSSAAIVIFTTPEAENGHGRIPRFTPIPADANDSATSYFAAERFHDHDGTYHFRVGLTLQGFGNIFAVDSDVFYDGSEHHIYGKVELFGVRFKNDFEEPLVFRISGGKYVYVKGNGTATTEDGSVIQFGE
jgi:hypothetical protein